MAQLPLTRRQRDILAFFQSYSQEQGISPTLEEVAQNFGVNKVTIFGHVAELERKGALSRAGRNISRALKVVEQAPMGPAPTLSLPILGSIAAGQPIGVLEEPEQLEFSELVPAGRDVYVLRVRGNSMIEDAICDGDLVIVERRTHAQPGETVVAVLPGEEATLKRYYPEHGQVRLQPANAAMQPIVVPEVELRGVVIGVLRRF